MAALEGSYVMCLGARELNPGGREVPIKMLVDLARRTDGPKEE